MPESSIYREAQDAVDHLRERLPSDFQQPKFAVICGSGLSGLADTIDTSSKIEFDYSSIPHFPSTSGTVILSR